MEFHIKENFTTSLPHCTDVFERVVNNESQKIIIHNKFRILNLTDAKMWKLFLSSQSV